MQKKLCAIGNSLAVVIDKPIRNMLGIKRDTVLTLTTDGRRLVIEASREQPVAEKPQLSEELDAVRVFDSLVIQHGMGKERFARLHPDKPSLTRYLGWLKFGPVHDANPAETATMRRLRHCLDSLEAGRSWDDTIAAALLAFPMAPVA